MVWCCAALRAVAWLGSVWPGAAWCSVVRCARRWLGSSPWAHPDGVGEVVLLCVGCAAWCCVAWCCSAQGGVAWCARG